ncbi:MAG: pantetheine-phosphate adenylyltransferase [Candidatus Lokiarchaeota archaeon]|jgi:pantetheine-phosphate adenylyltransferase
MGGTFDHLHQGHKYLIQTGLTFSKKLVIGLISDDLLKNKACASKIEPYQLRKTNLLAYISSIASLDRVEIEKLVDIYGSAIYDPEYEALIVSQETYQTALKINEIRVEKGFNPLLVIVIPFVKDKNNKKISSTAIRKKLS